MLGFTPEDFWRWLGDHSAPLQAVAALIAVVLFVAGLAKFVWKSAWPVVQPILMVPVVIIVILRELTKWFLVSLWRVARWSLSLLPFRVVRSEAISQRDTENERLRAEVRQLRSLVPPPIARPRPLRPLSLQARCEKLAGLIDTALGEYDHADPRQRQVGVFRWVRRELDPINAELEQLGWHSRDLDLARSGDNDRAEVERARDALRAIDWPVVNKGRPS